MPAYYLEALTITLGLILLLAEAFVPATTKAWVGMVAALGLAVILGLTCLAIGPAAKPAAAWAHWPLEFLSVRCPRQILQDLRAGLHAFRHPVSHRLPADPRPLH